MFTPEEEGQGPTEAGMIKVGRKADELNENIKEMVQTVKKNVKDGFDATKEEVDEKDIVGAAQDQASKAGTAIGEQASVANDKMKEMLDKPQVQDAEEQMEIIHKTVQEKVSEAMSAEENTSESSNSIKEGYTKAVKEAEQTVDDIRDMHKASFERASEMCEEGLRNAEQKLEEAKVSAKDGYDEAVEAAEKDIADIQDTYNDAMMKARQSDRQAIDKAQNNLHEAKEKKKEVIDGKKD